jgi:hypothetical protein
MQNGTYIPTAIPFGYYRGPNGIAVHTDEARCVSSVFELYLAGYSSDEIADHLNEAKSEVPVLTKIKWTRQAVVRILRNEKYTGDSLWQKTYRSDSLPRKAHVNKGERTQYFVSNTHPAIIDQVTFQKTQDLLLLRKDSFHRECDACGDVLQGRIICGCCGSRIRSKRTRGIVYRVCRGHDTKKDTCGIKQIPDSAIHAAFLRLYHKLKHHGGSILKELTNNLQTIRRSRMLWSQDVVELNKRISELTSQNQMLAELKQQGLVDPDFFISQTSQLAEQLRAAKLEKQRHMDAEGDDTIARTQELIEVLDAAPDFLPEFDGELFVELVDRIIVEDHTRLRFRLKNGLEVREPLERT